MKAKITSLFISILLIGGTAFLMPINVNASMLLEGSTCKPVIGGSCECAEGQVCDAGLFKCSCKMPNKQLLEQN